MSISDRLDQISRQSVEADEQWDCGRSAFNANNHAPPIDAALANGDLMVAALRAVLDLHPAVDPEVSVEHYREPDYCPRCREYYPCPTVRAITTALGEGS